MATKFSELVDPNKSFLERLLTMFYQLNGKSFEIPYKNFFNLK